MYLKLLSVFVRVPRFGRLAFPAITEERNWCANYLLLEFADIAIRRETIARPPRAWHGRTHSSSVIQYLRNVVMVLPELGGRRLCYRLPLWT